MRESGASPPIPSARRGGWDLDGTLPPGFFDEYEEPPVGRSFTRTKTDEERPWVWYVARRAAWEQDAPEQQPARSSHWAENKLKHPFAYLRGSTSTADAEGAPSTNIRSLLNAEADDVVGADDVVLEANEDVEAKTSFTAEEAQMAKKCYTTTARGRDNGPQGEDDLNVPALLVLLDEPGSSGIYHASEMLSRMFTRSLSISDVRRISRHASDVSTVSWSAWERALDCVMAYLRGGGYKRGTPLRNQQREAGTKTRSGTASSEDFDDAASSADISRFWHTTPTTAASLGGGVEDANGVDEIEKEREDPNKTTRSRRTRRAEKIAVTPAGTLSDGAGGNLRSYRSVIDDEGTEIGIGQDDPKWSFSHQRIPPVVASTYTHRDAVPPPYFSNDALAAAAAAQRESSLSAVVDGVEEDVLPEKQEEPLALLTKKMKNPLSSLFRRALLSGPEAVISSSLPSTWELVVPSLAALAPQQQGTQQGQATGEQAVVDHADDSSRTNALVHAEASPLLLSYRHDRSGGGTIGAAATLLRRGRKSGSGMN